MHIRSENMINAEDPVHHFRPSSGNISLFKYPEVHRFDTFIHRLYQLTPSYDSLLGKLVVSANNRNEAILRSRMALENVHVHGVETNISFLKSILESNEFSKNQVYTRFCNDILPSFIKDNIALRANQPVQIPIIAFVYLNFQKASDVNSSIWKTIGYWRTMQEIQVKYHADIFDVVFQKTALLWFYRISNVEYTVQINDKNADYITINLDENIYKVFYSFTSAGMMCLEVDGFQYIMESPDLLRTASLPEKNFEAVISQSNGHIRAPLHGRVTKINVLVNAKINRGDVLLVIESMKTENHIVAPQSGTIKTIHVSEGNQVKDNMLLIELEYFNV